MTQSPRSFHELQLVISLSPTEVSKLGVVTSDLSLWEKGGLQVPNILLNESSRETLFLWPCWINKRGWEKVKEDHAARDAWNFKVTVSHQAGASFW